MVFLNIPDQRADMRELVTSDPSGMFLEVVRRYGVTQHLNINEQLMAGIRYLDIRPVYLPSQDDFFVHHGLYGKRISTLLEEVRST